MGNTPKLRFEGFTGDWERRKLGEISFSFEYGLNAAAKEYDGINKYLRITDIDDESRAFKEDDLTSPDTDISSADSYRLQDGDILFARTGASVGKTYIYRKDDGRVYFAGFLIRAKIKKECDAEFVFQNTLSSAYEKYIQITSQRSGQPGVNAHEYAEYSFSIPGLIEQYSVGNYLHEIDNLVKLYHQKCTALANAKQFYLQNMFPQEGERMPKLRFAGFTSDWRKYKLGNITDSYSGGTPTAEKKEYYDGNIPFIRSGEISKDYTELYISESGLKNSSAALVNKGVILYALYGATSGEVSRSKIKGAINQAILAIQPKQGYDAEFLMQWLRMKKKSIINTYLQGGQGNLSGKIVKDLVIDIPDFDEQTSIAKVLASIDNFISLQQHKITALQTMKQFMLQNMFV